MKIQVEKDLFYILIILTVVAVGGFFVLTAKQTKYSTVTGNINSANIGLEVGDLAPNFQLIDSDGKNFTRDSLTGKPTMIFFTTTYCVPCQIGAKELLKYDLETGGNAFNVVIVFVDPRETNADIKQWKTNFGGAEWFTALDTNGMAYDYQVKYLDTKYILNKNGIIVWKDFLPLRYENAKKVLSPLI